MATSADFVDWIIRNGIEVIVWDMDCTMSAGHCGAGLLRDNLSKYIDDTSKDFVHAMNLIYEHNLSCKLSQKIVRCAVATGSDPLEYDLPGQSRSTHILGPDLATEIIRHHCPHTMSLFEIMIGYDCRLHENDTVNISENRCGKRHHMRLIQQHYGVPFHKMLLIDDSTSSLENEDGWIGVKVDGRDGFKFEHIPT